MRKHWKILHERAGDSAGTNNQKDLIKEIVYNGKTHRSSRDCANALNEFFVNITQYNTMDEKEALKNVNREQSTIFLYPTNTTEVRNIIKKW